MATRMLAVLDRLQDAEGFAPGALLRFYANETTTPLSVYSDEALTIEYAQPIECDAYGTAPPIYYDGSAPYRVLATDADGAPLPGFPRDDMVGMPAELAGADSIAFTPTEGLPFTTVQAAIEGAAALAGDQLAIQDRALTPWTTGGTGNAYTTTPTPAVINYGTFLALRLRIDRANTGAATLNVNGLGERDLKKTDRTGTLSALGSGNLQPGDIIDVAYDGTQFVVQQAMPATVSGGSSNLIRFPFGLQVAWGRATLAFASSASLSAAITFDAAFVATPNVLITLPNTALGVYTGVTAQNLGVPDQGTGTSGLTIRYLMAPGQTISAGASITNVGWTAIGRWF